MNTLRKTQTLRCSRIGVALSFLLLPLASSAANIMSVAQPIATPNMMTAPADAQVFYFEAHLTDGSTLSFPFSEQPTLRNQGNDLVLTTTKEEVNLPHGSVEKFTIAPKDASTGIEEQQVRGEVRRADDVFYFSGCQSGTLVRVFNGAGTQVTTATIAQDGTGEVSLQHQPAGIYIIKSASVNFKYLKK